MTARANGRTTNGLIRPDPNREKGQNSDVEWILSSERKYKLPIRYQPVIKTEDEKLKVTNLASISTISTQMSTY